jgi:hypothetical protein
VSAFVVPRQPDRRACFRRGSPPLAYRSPSVSSDGSLRQAYLGCQAILALTKQGYGQAMQRTHALRREGSEVRILPLGCDPPRVTAA